jgi:hypothetical protein
MSPQLDNNVVGWGIDHTNHLVWILLNLEGKILGLANIDSLMMLESMQNLSIGWLMTS